jgi:hypothetical protein
MWSVGRFTSGYMGPSPVGEKEEDVFGVTEDGT